MGQGAGGIGWRWVSFQHCSIFEAVFPEGSYDLVYDCGCFHHLAPHRRQDYVEVVTRALKPGGGFGLVCFRPEGGSGYTDQQVYERASLGGGQGYSADRLRALWDRAPFSVCVLRQMRKPDGGEPCLGADFLWVLLATKDGAARRPSRSGSGGEVGAEGAHSRHVCPQHLGWIGPFPLTNAIPGGRARLGSRR
jgi:SAM-dependent methyltransferase